MSDGSRRVTEQQIVKPTDARKPQENIIEKRRLMRSIASRIENLVLIDVVRVLVVHTVCQLE